MASVTIQAGPFTVQIEDEDEDAKTLTKLAHKKLVTLVTTLEVPEEAGADA